MQYGGSVDPLLVEVPYIILYVVCVQSEEATVAYVRCLALAGDTAQS